MKNASLYGVALFVFFFFSCGNGANDPTSTDASSSSEEILGSSIKASSSSNWQYSCSSFSSSEIPLSSLSSSSQSSSSFSSISSSEFSEPISTAPLKGASGTFADARDGQVYKWVKVGLQYWMAENLNFMSTSISNWIASIGSDDYARTNPDGRIRNGVYYEWEYVMNNEKASLKNPSGVKGICPEGWHLPSKEEVIELKDYLELNSADIKSQTEWVPQGKDQYGFNARPSGFYEYGWKAYGARSLFWMASAYKSGKAYFMTLYPSTGVNIEASNSNSRMNVRCLSDQYDGSRVTADYSGQSGILHDARDNTDYTWVGIGNQKWFAQDMKLVKGVTYFSDSQGSILYDWANALNIDPKYNTQSVPDAVLDPKNLKGICPEGSRIPNKRDWQILGDYFGGSFLAGKYLKAISFSGTDEVGFNALPTGVWFNGNRSFNTQTYYVSAELTFESSGSYAGLKSESEELLSLITDKILGTAVRCILVEPK